ncbi:MULTISPECIES: hypothetical protein [unclassified Campylobacter]|uniref:hypothetical protein n=1 Tax=unclassified Campylobacter TaxID=2593542 RepID=UPI0022E9F210|nr:MULTISPECIES: hypothetical protein [unclassified Campylobacter]MDA3048212.1 hypothetical protein [Campylobacter sp. JMF_08 NE1]MDA3055002.1 hypothetical protein [Campylobacter sp. VBCF_07 NA4]MDA3060504.1 hypothetical protein [Campylobacter sp. VBCF_02 NA5]MDA3070230.1 hypothetical protein [Campylobacter sp. VBCF_08 NA3]
MKKMGKKTFKGVRIDDTLLEQINEKIQNTNQTFSDIVNVALFKFIDKKSDKNSEKIQPMSMAKDSVEIRFFIPQQEYKFLQNQAEKNGFSSATKEIKFLLLNFIYGNEKVFNNIEMKELTKATNDLNILGRNISEIIRYLRTHDPFNLNINYNGLERLLTDINTQIKTINDLVTDYRAKLRDKF